MIIYSKCLNYKLFKNVLRYSVLFSIYSFTFSVSDIPPKVSKHYKRDKMRYWNVNLPRALSQSLLPSSRPQDKFPSRYPSILREFPPPPEPESDYSEKYFPNPQQSNPDLTKTRDFDPPPWIEPPQPKSEEDRENFNPYDNFGSRPQVGRPLEETISPELEAVVKNSSTSTILIVLGVIFLLINLFAFVIIFYQKIRLSMREHVFNNARMRHFQCTSRNPCDGDVDEYEFTDEEVESQIYMKKAAAATSTTDVKSILKNNNSDYEAVSTNKQGFAERKTSTSTVDTNMKVRQWIVEKCTGDSQFELDGSSEETSGKVVKSGNASGEGKNKGDGKQKENIYVERKDRANVKKEGNYDVIKSRKISNGSSVTKKQGVKKVSVAIDATPSARTASVLRQIPIEISKSSKSLNEISKDESEVPLVLRKNKSFDYPEDETVDEKSRTLPSNFNKKRSLSTTSIHELKQLIDSNRSFQEIAIMNDRTKSKQKATKALHKNEANILDDSSKNGFRNLIAEDINVTSRDENETSLPLTHQQMMNGIKRRNFPKVLPEYPQTNDCGSLPAIPIDVRRLSLPPNSFDLCSTSGGAGIPKIPPLPPPRISSTLGRKPQQPLHKSQVFIQLNKNDHMIPETIDENTMEMISTNSDQDKAIERAIDDILKSPPKLVKQNSIDLESTINQVESNLKAIEQTQDIQQDNITKPNEEKNDRSSGVSDKPRTSNSFENAIKRQKNKILNKLSGSSSGEGGTKKHGKLAKNEDKEQQNKEKSPECINLSEENVFYETVFHNSSVPNVVHNSRNISAAGNVNNTSNEIPFVNRQQDKTPEEIYKTLKMIRLEKEKLESNSTSGNTASIAPNYSSISSPSLPINDKTSTYAIIRNTNQSPQHLLHTQPKPAKVLSKEPKYIIKPHLSQITSSTSPVSSKIPHAVVNNTAADISNTSTRVATSNKTTLPGVQSNIMIGTHPNILTGVHSLNQTIPNAGDAPTSKLSSHASKNQSSSNISKIPTTPTNLSNVNNNPRKDSPNLLCTTNVESNEIKTNAAEASNSNNSNVPNNPSSNVQQAKLVQEHNLKLVDGNNDVTRTNSNSSKISANKKSTSTETLSSDKTCSSTQSSKSNNANVSGMSTIKRKKKS